MLYVHCLMLNDQYLSAENILNNIHILPYEGATSGRKLYEQTKLMLALEALKKHKYKTTLQKVREAGEWPRNLGVGKPYTNMIDSRLEDSLRRLIHEVMKNKKQPINYDQYELKIKAISVDGDY